MQCTRREQSSSIIIRNTKIQKCKNTKIQKCKNTKIQKCKNAKMHHHHLHHHHHHHCNENTIIIAMKTPSSLQWQHHHCNENTIISALAPSSLHWQHHHCIGIIISAMASSSVQCVPGYSFERERQNIIPRSNVLSEIFSPLFLIRGGGGDEKSLEKWESGTGVRKKLKILAWVRLVIVFFLNLKKLKKNTT